MVKYRKDINSLRGFSIIIIILYHFNISYFSGGFIGVEIFNVISGYLLYISLKAKSRYCSRYIHILIRKITRIVPTSHLFLFFLTIYQKFPFHYQNDYIKESLSSVLFFNNIWNYYKSTDYFSQFNSPSIILHYWYLSLEIQFVIIFLILFYILLNRIYIITLISFFINIVYTYNNKMSAYFLIESRIWEFIFPDIFTFKSKTISLFSFLILILCSSIYKSTFLYPGFYSFIPVVCSLYILTCGDECNNYINISILSVCGYLSYSLYIVHYPFIINNSLCMFKKLFYIVVTSIFMNFLCEKLSKKYISSKILLLLCILLVVFLVVYLNYLLNQNLYILHSKQKVLQIYTKYRYHHCYYCCYNEYLNHNFSHYILFIGDSHILHFIPGFWQYSRKYNCKLVHKYIFIYDILQGRKIFLFDLFSRHNFEIILTSFMYPHIITRNGINRIYKYLNQLSNNTKYLIHVDDNPRLKVNPIDCYLSNDIEKCYGVLNKDCFSPQNIIINNRFKSKIITFNFSNIYYSNNICNFIYNNISIYADTNHLSYEFSNIIGKVLINKIKLLITTNLSYREYNTFNCMYFLTENENHYTYCKKKC